MNFTRKRRHVEMIIDINDVLFCINRSLIRAIYDAKEFYLQDNDHALVPKFVEFSLLEIFRTDEEIASTFLLYYLKREISSASIGISINGQSRGLSTRIMVEISKWTSFKRASLETHFLNFSAERDRKIANVMTPESKLKNVIEKYDAPSIKRILGQKHSQNRMFERITNLYTSLTESEDIIVTMKKEKEDMQEIINSLENAIRRLQRNSEGSKRRIAASKGQMTKRLNALALETTNRDIEWKRCESILVRKAGHNKMISTKNATTLRREKEKLNGDKVIQNSKISLPLTIFDNIKENIDFLNKYTAFESIKAILCTVLTITIPPNQKRPKENSSNNAISNLLGVNNKSLLMKHVFEKCELLSKLKSMPHGTCTVGMIENALTPITR